MGAAASLKKPPTVGDIFHHEDSSDEALIDQILPVYLRNPARFNRVIAAVQFAATETRPLFPKVDVSSVPAIEADKIDAFKKKHINSDYISSGQEYEKRKNLKTSEIQYRRWEWATKNTSTYVNMLRLAGHSDETIQAMYNGRPMCFASQEVYDELCAAMTVLCNQLEKELSLNNCVVVITGSSVPGFSQNPFKGRRDQASKITCPSKSDVDVCIVADGVSEMIARIQTQNETASDADKIKLRSYPTTSSRVQSGTRFGFKSSSFSKISKSLGEFHAAWHQVKLKGGLQITFSDEGMRIPPWEARLATKN